MSGDQPTQKIPKKAYFLFVINLIKISKKIYHIGRSLIFVAPCIDKRK